MFGKKSLLNDHERNNLETAEVHLCCLIDKMVSVDNSLWRRADSDSLLAL